MANETSLADWVSSLPPQLQGFFILGAGAALAYMAWRKFMASYKDPDAPKPQAELIVGDSASFADLRPIKDLTENVSLLTLQLMKNEVAASSMMHAINDATERMLEARIQSGAVQEKSQLELMQSLRELADLLSQHLVDVRQAREEQEDKDRETAAREAGYKQAMAELGSPTNRPVRRGSPGAKKQGKQQG